MTNLKRRQWQKLFLNVLKCVRTKCEDRQQPRVARPHTGCVESNLIRFMNKSLKSFAAGYHSFSYRPDIDFNYFLLLLPLLCRLVKHISYSFFKKLIWYHRAIYQCHLLFSAHYGAQVHLENLPVT